MPCLRCFGIFLSLACRHEDAGVPVTNYGLFLSYVQSPQALERVLEPWGVQL